MPQKFLLLYLFLYCLDCFISLAETPEYTKWFVESFKTYRSKLVIWVGKRVFDKTLEYTVNGSGDKTYDYVEAFVLLLLALLGSIIWWSASQQQNISPFLLDCFHAYLRYVLVSVLLGYGLVKVFPKQFSPNPPTNLMISYGNSSSMGFCGVLWARRCPIRSLAAWLHGQLSNEQLMGQLLVWCELLHNQCVILQRQSEGRLQPVDPLRLEALKNIVEHAQSQRVFIHFSLQPDAIQPEQVQLDIQDDGCGFEIPNRWLDFARQGRFGLLMMAETTNMIQGVLQVDSILAEGSRLSVTAPICMTSLAEITHVTPSR